MEHNFKTTAESSPPLTPTTAPSFLSFAACPLMKSFKFSVFNFKSISSILLMVSPLFFKNIINAGDYNLYNLSSVTENFISIFQEGYFPKSERNTHIEKH